MIQKSQTKASIGRRRGERMAILALAALLALGGGTSAQEPAEPLPPNVEKFVVKTTSAENREVPFYVRPPASYLARPEKRAHRVLFLCPHYNQDGLALLNNPTPLLELADQEGWFVIVPTFRNKGDVRDRSTCYYYPERFSGKAVIDALELIRKKYPIATDGLLLQGYSGGAQFVHRFAIWAPDRVAAVAVNSSSWFDAPKAANAQQAWLVTIGDSDPAYEASLEFVDQLRKTGALPLFRSYMAVTHAGADRGGVKQLDCAFLRFYDDLTEHRLGKPKPITAEKPQPPMAPAAMAYVGDAQDWRFFKNAPDALEYISEDSRVYLPNDALAKLWGEAERETAPGG